MYQSKQLKKEAIFVSFPFFQIHIGFAKVIKIILQQKIQFYFFEPNCRDHKFEFPFDDDCSFKKGGIETGSMFLLNQNNLNLRKGITLL